MAEIFPPAGVDLGTPDWGLGTSPTVKVDKQTLGDGYEYREPVGLNFRKESFQPTWSNLSPAVALQAYNFLLERLEWKAFDWIHPVTKRRYQVTASNLSIEYDTFDNAILKVTLTQDFNPVG